MPMKKIQDFSGNKLPITYFSLEFLCKCRGDLKLISKLVNLKRKKKTV